MRLHAALRPRFAPGPSRPHFFAYVAAVSYRCITAADSKPEKGADAPEVVSTCKARCQPLEPLLLVTHTSGAGQLYGCMHALVWLQQMRAPFQIPGHGMHLFTAASLFWPPFCGPVTAASSSACKCHSCAAACFLAAHYISARPGLDGTLSWPVAHRRLEQGNWGPTPAAGACR